MSPTFVINALAQKPRTLRSLVQLAASHYDPLGLSSGLLSQIRHTCSTAMKLAAARWDAPLPNELWVFFIEQLCQLFRCTLHEHVRFPRRCSSGLNSALLLVLGDAGGCALVLHGWLLHKANRKGLLEVLAKESTVPSICTHKTYLASGVRSIPQRETEIQCKGAMFSKAVVSELAPRLSGFLQFSDSRVSIF